jgi:hypothetical protein
MIKIAAYWGLRLYLLSHSAALGRFDVGKQFFVFDRTGLIFSWCCQF